MQLPTCLGLEVYTHTHTHSHTPSNDKALFFLEQSCMYIYILRQIPGRERSPLHSVAQMFGLDLYLH